MDPEVKRQLDLRLARGEISNAEYVATLQTIRQHSQETPLSVVLSKVRSVFEKYEMVTPTASSPLVVNGDLALYDCYLTYKGRCIRYDEITSLGYRASKSTTNGMLSAYSAEFYLLPSSGQCVSVSISMSEGRLIAATFARAGEKPIKLLENAYLFLRDITAEQRLWWTMRDMKTKGFLDLSGKGQVVKLYPDGFIEKGNIRINLKEAHGRKLIQFGTSGWTWESPNTVVFRESHRIFSPKIEVGLWVDYDVMKTVILWLAEGKPA
jgi:hypothetical protein